MARKIIGTQLDRENRNAINHNFKELYEDTGASKAFEAADRASEEADYAKTQGDYAKSEGDYAKAQGDYAKNTADSTVASLNTIHDDDTNTTYNWGLKQRDGHVIFMYEEA